MADKAEAVGYTFWHVRHSGDPWEVRDGTGKVVESFATLDAVRDWVRGGRRDG